MSSIPKSNPIIIALDVDNLQTAIDVINKFDSFCSTLQSRELSLHQRRTKHHRATPKEKEKNFFGFKISRYSAYRRQCVLGSS